MALFKKRQLFPGINMMFRVSQRAAFQVS
uniref:Uncharacterized protein n=1 Tax=Anguilla anguilla TaxID=7936 RepID=A0A0E9UAP4_ANGAN